MWRLKQSWADNVETNQYTIRPNPWSDMQNSARSDPFQPHQTHPRPLSSCFTELQPYLDLSFSWIYCACSHLIAFTHAVPSVWWVLIQLFTSLNLNHLPELSSKDTSSRKSFFFFFYHLYWSIIASQWCVSFCFIPKWIGLLSWGLLAP